MLKDSFNSVLDMKSDLDIKDTDISAFITRKSKDVSSEKILEESLMHYNLNSENIASCNQIHSNKVQFITEAGVYNKTDGLICSFDSNLVLLIQTADCVPIFIVDNLKGLMGLVHSGWKGTYQNIITSALSIFFAEGSKKNNIRVYIGPSIRQCCYEIKEDVSKYFNKKYINMRNDNLYLNLLDKIKDDIISEGIDNHNICSSQICTFEDQKYYSYRKGDNGRIYSAIGSKE